MKSRAKRILGWICLFLVLLAALAYFFREPILRESGEFMAPRGDYTADIAILEGNEYIDRGIVSAGLELLKAGKVRRIIVVLHNIAQAHRPYGLNENYPGMVEKELQKLGLKEKDFEVMVVHIEHPLTLTEAKGALKEISKENVKTAILLSSGFHTRRSYLVYQHAAEAYQIKIYPQACFTGYQAENWWEQERGARDFSAESVKLAYYLLMGHIPFRFSY